MYINRDLNNKINGVFACEQFPNQEFLVNDNEELQTFLNPPINPNIAIFDKLDVNQQKYLRALIYPGYKYSNNTSNETYNADYPQGLTWAEYYASQDQALRSQLQ